MSDSTQGSRLKPDAPEFIPLGSKHESDKSLLKLGPKEAAKLQIKREKEEKKAASLNKKAGKKARFEVLGT